MINSILTLVEDVVLNDCIYDYTLKTDFDDRVVIINFGTKCVYQKVFERLLKVTPLLEKECFHWQVYVDFNGDLCIMIF